MGEMVYTSNRWIAWTAGTLLASMVHVLIDLHIGLYGDTSSRMSSLQAANLFFTGLVYGWWVYMIGVASTGNKSALVSVLIVAVLWGLLGNGVAALAASPPPSSAFPYQDIAHVSCIAFGAGASAAIWRASRSIAAELSWAMPIASGVVLISAFVVQSVLFLQNSQ
jgi:hypothetical protein